MKFSGHDSFTFRYTWFPKAVRAIKDNNRIFSNIDDAIVKLGIGKNMVRSISFWIQAADIAYPNSDKTYSIAKFGETILGENGLDQFLEDTASLWLIHWNISTNIINPIFAWDYMLNNWYEPDISITNVLNVFNKEAEKLGKKLSNITLKKHFEIFLHTYVPTRGNKNDIVEDTLDCPLVELELIQKIGERIFDVHSNKQEYVYTFRREDKPELSQILFTYFLLDFFEKKYKNENTIPFREIAFGYCSPGQIFKLPDSDIRHRLESIEADSNGIFIYQESSNIQQLIKKKDIRKEEILKDVF